MKVIGWSKLVVFPVCLIPVGYLGLAAYQGNLGANPLEVITHTTGDWTIRFLLITLSVTPLRQLTKQYWMIQYRRMLGLFAFFYGTLHLTTYLWFDKFFSWPAILEDIGKRKFITVGFLGFVLMIPLALTSTTGWIRRLVPPSCASFSPVLIHSASR
jgi:sulfoxide reductase heme-binding subunit YedZ